MNKDIKSLREKLEARKERLLLEVSLVDEELVHLQENCSHPTIIKVVDDMPHKVGVITTYVCSDCNRRESLSMGQTLQGTVFASSIIVEEKKKIKVKQNH